MSNDERYPNEPPQASRVAIVGMGASAGGLEAFQQFFEGLPDDSGLAFVLVQHLAPHQETHMPELLARHSRMTFEVARDGVPAAPNTVYCNRPGTLLTIVGGCLRVQRLHDTHGVRHPIDRFLRSLADDMGGRSIGVVLSGSGSDGMLGLQAIKEHGGLTIAQSPESARFDSMPRNAIALGAVDQVLAPGEMPELLIAYARRLHEQNGREVASHLGEICRTLHRRVQHDFSQYKQNTLVRRIERRMLVLQIESAEAYAKLLRRSDEEVRRLFKDLLISVTTFFRDPEAFEALKGIIRDLVAQPSRHDRVRVWVPGCATGEEAYSLAMLVAEETARTERVLDVQIFATDIDEDAIKVAREGCYPEGIAEHVSPERLRRFFVQHGDRFQVVKSLRDMCIFSEHNLISHPPFSRMDLVSCRNLLIYLQSELQDRLMALLHYALRPGGYLFLGPAESIGQQTSLFRTIDKKHRIFQARDVVPKPEVLFPLMQGSSLGHLTHQIHLPRVERARNLSAQHQREVLELSGFKSVLIDDGHKIVDMCGKLGRYLELGWGPLGDDIIDLARPELRVHLRSTIYKAQKSDEEVVVPDLTIHTNGEVQRFVLTVRRSSQSHRGSKLWLVIFHEVAPPVPRSAIDAAESGVSEDPLVRQLEHELESTREHLQATVEELQNANEELKTSVEELLSMNEELQSSNEELQTAKEELQSVNEELETVNAELQRKVEELDRAHADLKNLFDNTRIPTLFLDRDIRIKQFTPAAQEVLRLIGADVGRPLRDIAPHVEGADLARECLGVLETLVPREIPMRRRADEEGPERRYLLRIFPYRTLRNVVIGVILTFVDVTELEHATEAALRREQQQAAVARLGLEALSGTSIEALQQEAAELVQGTLQVEQSEVLMLLPGAEEFLLCAGIGWHEGLVGAARVPADRRSHAGYALHSGGPVLFEDLVRERRFSAPALLTEHGVRSGLACVIQGGEDQPWGVLGAHSCQTRTFSQQDADFLQTVANVLGSAVIRQHALDRLRASEAAAHRQAVELSTIYDTAAVGLALLDRDLRWVSINRTLAENVGVTVEQIIGRHPRELPLGSEIEPYLGQIIETGEAIREVEIQGCLPGMTDGERTWLYSLTPVKDEQDSVQAISVVVHDVTDQRRAELQIQESERRMRLAVEALEAGMFELAVPVGEHFSLSERCAQIIGRDREEIPPPDRVRDWLFAEIVHPASRDALEETIQGFIEGRVSRYKGDVRLRHEDGRWIWVSCVATAHRDAGGVRRVTGLIWDVTERWEAAETKVAKERLQAADRQKDDFLAMLGHELRNPLAAIRTSASLLQQLGEQEPLLQRIRAVLDRQTTHMARLLDGLLDVSRIARGKLRLHEDIVDLAAIVADVVADSAEPVQKRGLTLQFDRAPEPLWVQGDRTRLVQVFDNLVGNAIKFTEASGTIEVRARREDDSAVVMVRDTGIGIPPESMEHLFEPFQQAPQSIERAAGGLGLGLALVKGIVELHGGRTEAHSEGRGRGTEVRVWLPMVPPPRHEDAEDDSAPAAIAPMRLLVVEDNEDSAMMLRLVLERAGHHVDVAGTGTAAIDLARRMRPDAVLCDLGLPGMDGYEVARTIRGDESLRGTLLIALTGYGQACDRRKTEEVGFDAHLIKPADLDTIEATLARLQRARRPAEEA